jgi:Trypsin
MPPSTPKRMKKRMLERALPFSGYQRRCHPLLLSLFLVLRFLQPYKPCLAAAEAETVAEAAALLWTVEQTSASSTTTRTTILAQDDKTNASSSSSSSPSLPKTTKHMIPQPLQKVQQLLRRQLEPFQPTPKIIGGTEVTKGRYPYMVVLLDRSFQLICGGSLIAPNVVLTAAHCTLYVYIYIPPKPVLRSLLYRIVSMLVSPPKIVLPALVIVSLALPLLQPPSSSRNVLEYALVGPLDRTYLKSSGGGGAETNSSAYATDDDYELIRLQPEEYVHPFFNDTTLQYDVLIVLLERPSTRPYVTINADPNLPSETPDDTTGWIDPDDSTTTARQSNTEQDSSTITVNETHTTTDNMEGGGVVWNETLVALGFGVGSDSTKLQQVVLDYVNNDDCVSSSLGRDMYAGVISDDMMCSFRLGQDTCSGDSGGPLLLVRQRQTAPEYSWTVDSETVVIPAVVEEIIVQVGITSW